MATDLERLVVQLSADITKYERALNRANGIANQRTRAIETRFNRMQATISSGFNGLSAVALRAFAVIGGARGLQTLSDAATSIDNALKVAGLSGEELEKVYQQLKASALQNAAPIQTLVQLYGRLAIVQNELGVSSDQIVSFSNNIALALRVGGQTAQEASGALLQLSQSLGSGIVRAEEFNSILEGAPVILQAAARGIQQAEGSVAKLRQIMLAGNLSSKALFDGFQAGAPILEDRVAGSVFTLSQSFSNLYTGLVDIAREFNNTTGASSNAAAGINYLARSIDGVDVGGFIQKIRDAQSALESFFQGIPQFDGLNNLLGITNENGEFINPDFTAANDKVTALEREVADLQDVIKQNTELGFDNLDALNRLAEVRQSLQETRRLAASLDSTVAGFRIGENGYEAIPNREQFGPAFPTAEQRNQLRQPAATELEPIDIDQAKYRTSAEKSKKARKERLDDYAKEVERIRERTDAVNAETEVQSKLNPLINDYGYAVEFARSQQELTTAAIKAGKQITPELAEEIRKLADAYAMSGVAAEKLSESQDKIREKQKELLDLQRDVTRGLVDDLIEGKSAAEAFAGALKKVGNALLDQAFKSLFSPTQSGGGGGLGGLLSLIGFASGGYTGQGGKYDPAGIVHRGEYVIPKNVVDRIGVDQIEKLFSNGYANGGYVNRGLSRPVPSLSSGVSTGGSSFVFSPQVDARGASVEAVARLESSLAKLNSEFEARVTATNRRNQKSNVR